MHNRAALSFGGPGSAFKEEIDLASLSSDPDVLAAEAVRHLGTGDLAAAEIACRTALAAT